jgi:hypothetical protein
MRMGTLGIAHPTAPNRRLISYQNDRKYSTAGSHRAGRS